MIVSFFKKSLSDCRKRSTINMLEACKSFEALRLKKYLKGYSVLSSIPAVRKLLVILFPFAFLFLVSGGGVAVSGEMDFTMPCVCSVLDHR